MRAFITFLIILAVVTGAAAIYFVATTPHETAAVAFPLTSAEHAILASVPADADAFAYIPRAAALESRLSRNPVTREIIDSWRSERTMPRAWMIGGADLLVWQSGKQTRYLLRLDPVRAALVRIYLMASGGARGTVLVNVPSGEPIDAASLASIESLASRLPAGDALVVQRASSRGAFPPIGRPAVSSVSVGQDEIVITCRATQSGDQPSTPLNARLARGAILSASFQSAPRLFDDLNRLFGTKVSNLVSDGGSVALYDVKTGTLLPRPVGVISVPATGDRRPATDLLAKIGARTAEKGDQLAISFDSSLDAYLKDAIDATTVPGGRWAVRVDAPRMMPILERLRENVGLRIASPRMYRSARDLDRWISGLAQAKTIDASDVSDGSTEELKVRIATK